jgi:hypothetical protein
MRVRTGHWIAIWLIAIGTRVTAAFLLPNAEQDGYSYAEIIARLSAHLSSGHLRWADLFGFWFPLFQLVAAIPNVWIDNPLLAGKVLSALCGAGSCVLVFAITQRITRSIALGYLAFALIVFNPFHVLYSAACMTDVPYGFLVLASLWFLIRKRWLLAAIFAALAGCIRLEPWALIFLLPLIQFAYEKRVSIAALFILILPPLAWLALSYHVTGDAFAYFAAREHYHANYLDFYPTRHGFVYADVRQDVDYLLLGANRIVVLTIVATAILSIFRAVRRRRLMPLSWAAPVAYAAALFGLLLLAYVTKRQPVILPRYGLIFFPLGLPLLIWLIGMSIKRWPRSLIVKLAVVFLIGLCVRETKGQVDTIWKVCADFGAHQQVAHVLRTTLNDSANSNQRCFSDDVGVRVLSGLPKDRFVRSSLAPASAWQDAAVFESYLQGNQVAYLVFTRIEDSLPAKVLPELGNKVQPAAGKFQLIAFAASPFASDVWLYRLRDAEAPR